MKIMHVITNLTTGGAETMLCKLLSATDRNRLQSCVVSLKSQGTVGEPIRALGIPVYPLGMNTWFSGPFIIWRLISLIRRFQPNLIVGWMYHANLAAQITRCFLKNPIPVLWNIRHSVYSLRNEKPLTACVIKLGAKLSQKTAGIIYNSETSADQHESLGYCHQKRILIPNGFDTERFVPSDEARSQIRSELGLPPQTFLIGLIARYHPMKDHENFIRAAHHLYKSHPEIHFLLAGRGVTNNNEELKISIKEFNLQNRFHLLGERSDIHQISATLDIASCSSFSEGMPNAVGEAMACGVSCVVTNVGDSAYLVGNTGRVVPPKNPEALAKAWTELIELGPDSRKNLGGQARKRVEEEFSLHKIASQFQIQFEATRNQ